VLERIRALEPNFDPRDLPAVEEVLAESAARSAGPAADLVAPLAAVTAAVAASPLDRAGEIATPAGGRAVRDALPDEVYEATRSRDGSLLVVVALALSPDERTRDKQVALIERQLGATRAGLCLRLGEELAATPADLRLPVLELALPTLRQRPSEQLSYVSELLQRVQELERTPRLFDFVLLRLVETYLSNTPGAKAAPRGTAPKVDSRAAVRSLLQSVAAFGHDTAAGAQAAYAAGLAAAGWQPEPGDPRFEPPSASRTLATLDAALAALAAIRPREKERVLRAVLAAIKADAVTATEERELFRLIAASLGCPMPPDITL